MFLNSCIKYARYANSSYSKGFLFPLFLLSSITVYRFYTFFDVSRASLNHFFVTRSFYYSSSITSKNNGTQGTLSTGGELAGNLSSVDRGDSVVILLNVERKVHAEGLEAICMWGTPEGIWTKRRTHFEEIYRGYDAYQCRLVTYRIVCPGVMVEMDEQRFGQQDPFIPPLLSLSIGGSVPIDLPLTMADAEPREFVVCPGRMFAFEQWPLFLTAMELYRAHRVSLVVVYIQSVDEAVFDLIQRYEMTGIVSVRTSFRMPELDSLDYDPNTETIWNNQVVNFQHCLYEFKESADFIAFPDWDDLLVTNNPFASLPQIFQRFSDENIDVASFLPDRFPGYFATIDDMNLRNQSIETLWEQGLRFDGHPSSMQFISKAIILPKLVDSIDLHCVAQIQKGYREAKIPSSEVFVIHARDYTSFKMEFTLNTSKLVGAFRTFFRLKNGIDASVLERLPKTEAYLSVFNECLRASLQRVRRISKDSNSKCFSYRICNDLLSSPNFVEQMKLRNGRNCVNADTRWDSFSWVSKKMRVLVLKEVEFRLDKDCIT